MTDYTPTGKPDDGTRYDARALRREFDLVEAAVNSKSDVGSNSTVSTTSMLIESPATKTFTAETGKDFAIGQIVFIADSTDPAANSMTGTLVSYARDTTGVMIVDVTSHNGSGTLNDWSIGVSNQSGVTLVSNTFTGHQNFARATVASHATTADIWNAAGNQIDFTGTATVTDFPAASQGGAERTLICAAACSFVASADMAIDGVQTGGTLLCSAGDIVIVRALSTTTFRLSITRYSGDVGGATITSSAVDITLTSLSSKLQEVSMTADGKNLILPDATSIGEGFPVFAIRNSGLYPFGIRKDGGAFLCRLNPGQTAVLGCSDNSTAAGVWVPFGVDLEGVYRGNNSEVINAVDSRLISAAMLSSTQAICAFRNNSTTFLEAVILNYGSASGTPVAINAEASIDVVIATLTATKAVVAYRGPTNATKGYVLDVSGNTITPGTVQSLDATAAGSGLSLAALSATHLLLGYVDSGPTMLERVLSVSGTTITPGAETTADASSSIAGVVRVGAISAAKALYAFRRATTGYLNFRLQSISGSTPTPTGSALTMTTPFSAATAVGFSILTMDANRVLVAQPVQLYVEGDILITLLDVSGTTPAVLSHRMVNVGRFATDLIFSCTKLDADRVYVSLLGACSLGMDGFVVTISTDNKIFVGPLTEVIESSVTATEGYVACVALDADHVMNVCRNASTYLSAKVTEVAT